jgi:hypothetical protein
MSRRGSVLIGVVVGTLAAMLAGGIAWATIPGTDGVIHGCYKAKNGQLRLVGCVFAKQAQRAPFGLHRPSCRSTGISKVLRESRDLRDPQDRRGTRVTGESRDLLDPPDRRGTRAIRVIRGRRGRAGSAACRS